MRIKNNLSAYKAEKFEALLVKLYKFGIFEQVLWRRGGVMVGALVSGSSGLGLSRGRRHYVSVVYLGKTRNPHSAV